MNRKTKYAIPTIAAALSVITVLVGPVMAEQAQFESIAGSGPEAHEMDPLHYMVLVEGFEGAVGIQFDAGYDADIGEKITVSLAEAAIIAEENGLHHASYAAMEPIKNDQGEAYLVWKIHGYDNGADEKVSTMHIFVVDAGDPTNFAMTTHERNLFGMHGGMHELEEPSFEDLKKHLSEPTGDAQRDALQAEYLDLLEQLRDADNNGDSESVEQLSQQIAELHQNSVQISNPDI